MEPWFLDKMHCFLIWEKVREKSPSLHCSYSVLIFQFFSAFSVSFSFCSLLSFHYFCSFSSVHCIFSTGELPLYQIEDPLLSNSLFSNSNSIHPATDVFQPIDDFPDPPMEVGAFPERKHFCFYVSFFFFPTSNRKKKR